MSRTFMERSRWPDRPFPWLADEFAMARRRKRDIPPVHPGEILKADFLAPPGLSVNGLSRAIGVPWTQLNDIVLGRRGIAADTAMRLGRYFRVGARLWMNLHTHYALEIAEEAHGDRLDREVRRRARRERRGEGRAQQGDCQVITISVQAGKNGAIWLRSMVD